MAVAKHGRGIVPDGVQYAADRPEWELEKTSMLSVNTNTGAMIALQYLNQTQADLAQTQNAINTGLKVSSAKDDGAVYAIAQNMRGDVAGYGAVTDSLNRGMSAIDVAMSAGQSISDLLVEMKTKALAASDTSLDTTSRQAMNQDFVALRDQITTIVKNAVFNGYNLVDGSTTQITALASSDGTRRITAQAENLSLSGSIVTISTGASISTQAGASTMVAIIQASLTNVDSALAQLSSGSKKFSIQLDFAQKLSDSLTGGIGHLVDADMATESAHLQSLQVKQQLGVQALSIANQAPQTILSLFR
ncbi:MAG TPA: flagellin [Rhizomicrobium sp.]|jgi:flagellin|nr:flagellin [Rhizomicrobium sp.]